MVDKLPPFQIKTNQAYTLDKLLGKTQVNSNHRAKSQLRPNMVNIQNQQRFNVIYKNNDNQKQTSVTLRQRIKKLATNERASLVKLLPSIDGHSEDYKKASERRSQTNVRSNLTRMRDKQPEFETPDRHAEEVRTPHYPAPQVNTTYYAPTTASPYRTNLKAYFNNPSYPFQAHYFPYSDAENNKQQKRERDKKRGMVAQRIQKAYELGGSSIGFSKDRGRELSSSPFKLRSTHGKMETSGDESVHVQSQTKRDRTPPPGVILKHRQYKPSQVVIDSNIDCSIKQISSRIDSLNLNLQKYQELTDKTIKEIEQSSGRTTKIKKVYEEDTIIKSYRTGVVDDDESQLSDINNS